MFLSKLDIVENGNGGCMLRGSVASGSRYKAPRTQRIEGYGESPAAGVVYMTATPKEVVDDMWGPSIYIQPYLLAAGSLMPRETDDLMYLGVAAGGVEGIADCAIPHDCARGIRTCSDDPAPHAVVVLVRHDTANQPLSM